MTAKLIAEDGALKGLVLSFEEGDQWVVGRDPDACQLLIEDPSASRKHILCKRTPQGIVIENLSTSNPAQVNDAVITEPRLLKQGDVVRMGACVYRFYSEEGAHLFQEGEPDEEALGETLDINEEEVIEFHAEDDEEEADEQQDAQQDAQQKTTHHEEEKQENPLAPQQPQHQQFQEATNQSQIPAMLITEEELEKPLEDELALEKAPGHEDSVYGEEMTGQEEFAEINFDMMDTGRWLLKVIAGANSGAEFAMQTGSSYLLGTDPNICDIIFHDTSISRQHVRLSISDDDELSIEDLKSRNGTSVDGDLITGKQMLEPNTVVQMGTTSFVVYDREGEMQTIISPLLPSIVKVLQQEEAKKNEEALAAKALAAQAADEAAAGGGGGGAGAEGGGAGGGGGAGATAEELALAQASQPEELQAATPAKPHNVGALIIVAVITGLFVLTGIGVKTLFESAPVVSEKVVDADKLLGEAMSPFPGVRYSFNKATGRLLIVGHVMASTDRNQMIYNLQGLPFIKDVDDAGVIIDEYVWNEANQVLSKNPSWKGVTVHSPVPGKFVLSGYLKKRDQAEQVWDYMTRNFSYLDLLENKMIVEENILDVVNSVLGNNGFNTVVSQMNNGELLLSGNIQHGRMEQLEPLLVKFRDIPGVRSLKNNVIEVAPDEAVLNISNNYEVSGMSRGDNNQISVIINGRIVTEGDVLDGMLITSIRSNGIFLEKDGVKYRIDFKR